MALGAIGFRVLEVLTGALLPSRDWRTLTGDDEAGRRTLFLSIQSFRTYV